MIKKATYLHDYLIEVTFYDGTVRVADFEAFFKNSRNPLVRKFMSLNKFKEFYVDPEIETLAWGDNECDIDPFDIYEGVFDAQLEYA
jgi:hypothetical protein